MKMISYERICGNGVVQVMISYSAANLGIAKQEAKDGVYSIREVAADAVC